MLGAGNELCWQSLVDGGLEIIARRLHGSVGRFPGGTPSNYFNWRSGKASDCPFPEGPSTPGRWRQWVNRSGLTDTVYVVNQLTDNVADAIAALKAHRAEGQQIRYLELGNEMYDESDPNIVRKDKTPRDYAIRMARWTAALKEEFPEAKVALVGERWNPGVPPTREQVWNREVLQDPVSWQADAATIHVYAGGMPNAAPAPWKYPAFLRGAYAYARGNRQIIAEQVPQHLRVWVTEVGVFPAGPLDGTWLQAMYHATLVAKLLEIDRVDMVLPYCFVCKDPTAPVVNESGGRWEVTNKGLVLSLIFEAVREASTLSALGFDEAQPLVGWRAAAATGELRAVILNIGNKTKTLDIGGFWDSAVGPTSYTLLAAKSPEDMVRPSARPERIEESLEKNELRLSLPAYSATLMRGGVRSQSDIRITV